MFQANRDQPRRRLPSSIPCKDCQEDISELVNHKWRKRCESCQDKFEGSRDHRQVEYLKQKARRLASKRKLLRFCACGADISDRHGRAFRCKKCSRLTRSKGVGALDDASQTKGD